MPRYPFAAIYSLLPDDCSRRRFLRSVQGSEEARRQPPLWHLRFALRHAPEQADAIAQRLGLAR